MTDGPGNMNSSVRGMNLQQILRSNPALYRLAKDLRGRLRKMWRPPVYEETHRSPSSWLEQIVGEPEVQVVQIGSNDGNSGDPLFDIMQRRQGWRGLFVEPIPYLFERLKSNYGEGGRFKFENACINNGEKATFYWVDPRAKEFLAGLPDWSEQLGSFNKMHITNLLPGVEPFIVEAEVEGLSLRALLEKHGIEKVDVLHIDAEGYDWKILQQLDLTVFRPKIILYEYKHLSVEEGGMAAKFLKRHYRMYAHEGDAIAVRRDA